MGLHQLIFSVYTFTSALASSGIGIATTRLVSEHIGFGGKSAVKKILSRALGISLTLGVFSCALMYFCADAAALYWLKDNRAALSLKILSFGLPFMAVSSCLKGYFMARRKASTPSNSQLFEQLIRIGVVVFCLSRVDAGDLSQACAGSRNRKRPVRDWRVPVHLYRLSGATSTPSPTCINRPSVSCGVCRTY